MIAARSAEKGSHGGDPHTQFVQHVVSLRDSVVRIRDHFDRLTICFQHALEEGQGCTRILADASTRLSKDFTAVSGTFLECLSDLATMGEAMTAVAETTPDAASALMVNLYSTFFRQMKTYFCDAGDKFTQCGDLFEKGKKAFYKASSIAVGQNSSRRSSIPTTSQALKKSGIIHEVKDASEGGFVDAAPAVEEACVAGEGDYYFDPDTSSRDGLEASPTAALFLRSAAPYENGSEAEVPSFAAAEGGSLTGSEPPYVRVSTTVEDALGPLVLAHRPTQFAEVDAMLSEVPVASYYVRLVRPGSLAHFIVKNYFNVDKGVQTDLLCQVIETSRVEVEPMGSTAGEVVVRGGEDLSWVPSCAWRSSANEDHTHLFYTMYTLIEQTQTSSHMALIQDAVVYPDSTRVEVLHVVGLIDAAPQYAKLTVYTTALKGTTGSMKAAAIASLMRRSFRQLGFLEVDERVVREAVRGMEGGYRDAAQEDASEEGPIVSFRPTVQLASLDEPGQGALGTSLRIRNVARGAVRGGIEVLRAPLTLGRAVGEAVLDATGVSDAVRTSMENLLRKSFVELKDEKIIDFFNTAWVDGGVPKQGYLYMTEHWVCFVSPESNARFAIEFDEIKEIQKSKSSKVLNNAINITTHLDEEYFLTGFLKRDQTYSMLMKHWING
ncbi:unnamed protein product [Phytomonas sp. EM1]|nr:unnamed protein product [Phytomonas sp. EM1]|eukprot:CCW61574.1 unnamed protein product [Phytomonas sp. isolate EM1]